MIKSNKLNVRQKEPLNAGPSLEKLVRSEVTPTVLLFVRNHGDVPDVDTASYRLVIDGLVTAPLSLSLVDLKSCFPIVTLPVTLQCAGNRRDELTSHKAIPEELGWGAEAIGTAVWKGVRLRDVLAIAGINKDAVHLAAQGLDYTERHGESFQFGISIPLEKAQGEEVLLAFEMNGTPLTRNHGAPLRLVVPGYIGARSVKWLRRLTLQRDPSDNYFQAKAYRLFSPDVRADTVDWEQGEMLGELTVSSVICSPTSGATVSAGEVLIEGYAVTGGNRTVDQVELSVDGGTTWLKAELKGNALPYTWRLWQVSISMPPGEQQLVVRATDSAGNCQPESLAAVWNFKGYMNNAWHRISIHVS
jgi:sulfite oxidase